MTDIIRTWSVGTRKQLLFDRRFVDSSAAVPLPVVRLPYAREELVNVSGLPAAEAVISLRKKSPLRPS